LLALEDDDDDDDNDDLSSLGKRTRSADVVELVDELLE
jgi:hypothetical protein